MQNERSDLRWLLLRIELHEPRFHGMPEWPPAPARAFQALLAGVSRCGGPSEAVIEDLAWLESLEAPTIASPKARKGEKVGLFVPNNDLDDKGGDPKRTPEIRAGKPVQPHLLESANYFIYAWPFPAESDNEDRAARIAGYAEKIHQFGRGVDMAFAAGRVVDDAELATILASYPGETLRPRAGRNAKVLSCPRPGSLTRLLERYAAMGKRFTKEGRGRSAMTVFSQAPLNFFIPVGYNGQEQIHVYALRNPEVPERMATSPMQRTTALVTALRDNVVKHLTAAFPEQSALIEAMLIGQRPGDPPIPKAARVRILPLPSTGMEYVSRQIRRVMVIIPPDEAIAADDIAWAFGQVTFDADAFERGEAIAIEDHTTTPESPSIIGLEEESESKMMEHYGITSRYGFKRWQTVTPAALPGAARRRIDPEKQSEEAKAGAERLEEEHRAKAAVLDALRHAGFHYPVRHIAVQREPYARKGARAEAFAPDTRFEKERLWHVDVEFQYPQRGPIVIGDGRYLGLGLMEPAGTSEAGILAYSIVDGLAENAAAEGLSAALRRAVMARVQQILDETGTRGQTIPKQISGHEADGSPLRNVSDRVHYLYDPPRNRFLLVNPQRRKYGEESVRGSMALLREAMEGFCELRAGAAGRIRLESIPLDPDSDPLFASARVWESVTPYQVNRHYDCDDAKAAIIEDVVESCRRAGLPEPGRRGGNPDDSPRDAIKVLELQSDSERGLRAKLRIEFKVAIAGPLMLGRRRYKGGGLFAAAE